MPDELLSRAVQAFVSGGHRPYPTKDEDALVEEVGADIALSLLPRIRQIAAEVFDISVDWASIRREPYLQVQDVMGSRHPELSDVALRASSNYWAYQTKWTDARKRGYASDFGPFRAGKARRRAPTAHFHLQWTQALSARSSILQGGAALT